MMKIAWKYASRCTLYEAKWSLCLEEGVFNDLGGFGIFVFEVIIFHKVGTNWKNKLLYFGDMVE
jgi:hypothetical protein